MLEEGCHGEKQNEQLRDHKHSADEDKEVLNKRGNSKNGKKEQEDKWRSIYESRFIYFLGLRVKIILISHNHWALATTKKKKKWFLLNLNASTLKKKTKKPKAYVQQVWLSG